MMKKSEQAIQRLLRRGTPEGTRIVAAQKQVRLSDTAKCRNVLRRKGFQNLLFYVLLEYAVQSCRVKGQNKGQTSR